jgi:hypothetical protein
MPHPRGGSADLHVDTGANHYAVTVKGRLTERQAKSAGDRIPLGIKMGFERGRKFAVTNEIAVAPIGKVTEGSSSVVISYAFAACS